MHADTPRAQSRSSRRGKGVAVVLLAGVLLAGAWGLARCWPTHRASSLEEIECVFTGYDLLVSGAMPWLLQWAGLAVLTVAVARGCLRVNWGAVLLGILLPLCVGLIWWIGACAVFWRSDPFEATADVLAWSAARHCGGQSLLRSMLFELFGPLTFGWTHHRLGSLLGWDFVWTGVWSMLVMTSLTWVGRTRRLDASGRPKCTRGQVVLLVVWVLLYFGPFYIRMTLRIIDSL
jgi:hypothetical protein